MKYGYTQIQLNNKLSFWSHFKSEERFLLHNPQTKVTVMGAGRYKSIEDVSNNYGAPYVFSTKTFGETIKEMKWKDFGNENIIFDYYYVERDGTQKLYHIQHEEHDLDAARLIIDDIEPNRTEHKYKESSRDYGDWKKAFT